MNESIVEKEYRGIKYAYNETLLKEFAELGLDLEKEIHKGIDDAHTEKDEDK